MGETNGVRQTGPDIGIVDNDELTLMTLSHFLRSGLHASVWCATLGSKAISLCCDTVTASDVLLVDMSLNDMPGERVIERIRVCGCVTPVLAITSFPLYRYAPHAAAAGAQGIIAKRSLQAIRHAVVALLSGEVWDSGTDAIFHTIKSLPEREMNGQNGCDSVSVVALSPRERAVIDLFAQGCTSEEAAVSLDVSPNTVKTYAARAFAKLGARNRSQAVALWLAAN